MTVRGYLLGVDWFETNDPGSSGEDDTSDATNDDLTVSWGRDSTQAASLPDAADFTFVFENQDGRYSPENGASPLAGRVLPGRRVVFQHTGTGGDTVRLFDGLLDKPTIDPTSKEFTGSCLDAWGRPSAESLSTALFSGIRTGDAVSIILDAIGWEGARSIDPGVTVMPWWWAEGDDAATAIEKLVNSEGPPALAYVRAGTFVFEDRHHRILNTASTVTAGLYSHIIPAGSGPAGDYKMLTDTITYDHGLQRIINSATFTVDERRVGAPVEVWSTDTTFWIDAGTTQTFFVTASDPFINAATPLEGAGITSDTGIVVASLSRTSGASTILSVTAASGSLVSRLALTAQPVAVATTTKVQSEDAGSVGRFGRNTWPKDAPYANRYDCQAIADRVVTTYATNRPVVTFEIENLDANYFAQIRNRRLSDRITIRDDQLGVNDDYIIERLEHTVSNHFTQHRAKFTCEVPQPDQPENVFTFDVSGKGFNDGLFGGTGIDTASNVFMFDPPDQNRMPFGGDFIPDTTALWSKTGATFTIAPPGPFGNTWAQLTVVGTPVQAFARTPDSLPINGGQGYRISMIAAVASGTVPNVRISVDWYDSGGVYISTGQSTPDVTVSSIPQTVASGFLIAPSNAATGRLGPTIGASPGAGVKIFTQSFTFARIANGFDTGVFGT